MAEIVQMLALTPTMEEGTIFKWNFQEGEKIEEGDIVCEVETDKATMEFESFFTGTLLKIMVPEGDRVSVSDPIAIVGEEGEDISQLIETAKSHESETPKETPAAVEETPTATAPKAEVQEIPAAPVNTPTGRIRISPLAKKLAAELRIDYSTVQGSGPGGRIIKKDIENYKSAPASMATAPRPTLSDRVEPLGTKRKVIAQRLSESKFSAPHYYLKVSADFTRIVEARELLKSRQNISINSFIMKVAAEVIKNHPIINSSIEGENMVTHGSIDIAIAVSLDDGLITPVIRDCGNKKIAQIDDEMKELVELARANKLTPDQFTGATFTVSNLGNWGVEEFTAIINPPGSAILAIGAMIDTPVVREGEVVIRPMVKFTLSCDHRIIDGAVGGAFMGDLKDAFENPALALF